MQKSDRAFKIRKLIMHINHSFQKFGIFDKFLSVDEIMIRYYGYHFFKQFLKSKPIQFGYKFWAMRGVKGYCYNFDLYCGKMSIANTPETLKELLGTRVVKKMLQPVTNSNSHISSFGIFFLILMICWLN